jgi:N-methylhydantoinase B
MHQESFDPIRLEVFKHLLASVAEEMGVVLYRTGFSPNIKERRDYSCAVFDAEGQMVAQAAHIPVHLGSMPLSVQAGIRAFSFKPGDMVILNDPYHGGTHLPDITLIAPVFTGESGAAKLVGFVANRAHHSDVGGMAPGSMPLSQEVFQEGVIIPPIKLVEAGNLNEGVVKLILANVRTPEEREGDLRAQMAANQIGAERLQKLVTRYGGEVVASYMDSLLRYSERMTRQLLSELPDGVYRFRDRMDDDGIGSDPAEIVVTVTITNDEAIVDFAGTEEQQRGSINAVYAITLSAVYYVFRSLIGLDVPSNSGCMKPIEVIAPPGTLVNAQSPAAVAGGNVETSQRIVDVLLGALSQALPDRVPAASQGTMNNLTIGGWDPERRRAYAYYETIGGGQGGRPGKDGADAIHTHMTNTMNTPVEALEFSYPFRVRRYEIREGTGGRGRYRGGDGIRREIELLYDATITLLSDRRKFGPYGLMGGGYGRPGKNLVIELGEERELPGKVSLDVKSGAVVSVRTPGGGGHGEEG